MYEHENNNYKNIKEDNNDTIYIMNKENRIIFHGIVATSNGQIIKDAIVILMVKDSFDNPSGTKFVSYTFTDEYGQFVLGPLKANSNYIIKVWKDKFKTINIFKDK